MAYSGLLSFIGKLEQNDELKRIEPSTSPDLEITEITDRIVKSGGKALLFENTGKRFPLLINIFGSDRRMALALSRTDPYDTGKEIERLFSIVSGKNTGIKDKISSLPALIKISSVFPRRSHRKGSCQDVIIREPDLGILPVLKCWPHDGGRFITLPMVHTIHPQTGSTNVGMYRMQILDRNTTGMHWQRHKTGANHFEAWKLKGQKMPVSVALGGDPVYTYAATAPVPENINEYILAGFLRRKKVTLVKCITNDLYVPGDADIILEGYVDPAEKPVWEGPFGDHTGFYSLADWYPRFHVTCITHRKDAVYPATIVGIPPQEDAYLAKATERIFLAPVKMALLPEIIDFHMPDAGTAHNLVIVRINKSYPGQGMKVINSLMGAGQMMFSKYIIVVSGEIDIRDYPRLTKYIFENLNPDKDIYFTRGPLDVLDHASDNFSFGGKAGIDATIKHPEELGSINRLHEDNDHVEFVASDDFSELTVNPALVAIDIPVVIVKSPDLSESNLKLLRKWLSHNDPEGKIKLILNVDSSVDIQDYFMITWQILANTDPLRDHRFLTRSCIILDGTIKKTGNRKFQRKWPNVVCSDEKTIEVVDSGWSNYGFEKFIQSPSLKYNKLLKNGKDEIIE